MGQNLAIGEQILDLVGVPFTSIKRWQTTMDTGLMTTVETGTHNVAEGMARIKRSIEAEVKAKAEQIETEAKAEAARILEEAKAETEKLRIRILREQEAKAKQFMQMEISKKRLAAKMDYLQHRENMIDALFTDLKTELQKYTKNKEYGETLEKFLEESALAIGGGEMIVEMRSADKKLLPDEKLKAIAEKIEKETGVPTTFELSKTDLKTLGGVKVKAKDGSVSVDNTFEARMERLYDDLRVTMMNALVG